MKLRSTIDWNEIVPRLQKPLRDTLFLEAVMMLSGESPSVMPITAPEVVRTHNPHRNPRPPSVVNARRWGELGDGQRLCYPGRVFKIVKNAKEPPNGGQTGRVWAKLIESKNDQISYEGIASICKGSGVDR